MDSSVSPTNFRQLGRFLGAACASVSLPDGGIDGVVMIWERGLEVRGSVGRRFLPRSIVRGVSSDRTRTQDVLQVRCATGVVRVVGSNLSTLEEALQQWPDAEDGESPLTEPSPVWSGGAGWMELGTGRPWGQLIAGPGGLRFKPMADSAPGTVLSWASVVEGDGTRLRFADGREFHGPGVAAAHAVWLGFKEDLTDGREGFVVEVAEGWMQKPHIMAVLPGGLVLVPVGRWSWWWSDERVVRWSDLHGLEGMGPGAMELQTSSGNIRLQGWASSGLLAELRRRRAAVARQEDAQAGRAGRASQGFVVRARTQRVGPRQWGRLTARAGRVELDIAGTVRTMKLADLVWHPGSGRRLRFELTDGVQHWTVCPVGGHRVLGPMTRMLGPMGPGKLLQARVKPVPPGSQGSAEHRRDTRLNLAVDVWLDVTGAVPDTHLSPSTRSLELAMSSVVIHWTGTLEPGQMVGLALGLGGEPLPTRARVVRRVHGPLWALAFDVPPAALVHRIGSRVREWEREQVRSGRDGGVPLTVMG